MPSFTDSDGDGIGDLDGVRSRLGYLELLGVDALWLSPIYPSPMVDHGYDVTDHRAVDPSWGDLDALDALVADAHAHGIRVTIDLVPNHTSDHHAWFRAALGSPPGSPERARYHFRPGRADGTRPPNDWLSVFGGPAWTREPKPAAHDGTDAATDGGADQRRDRPRVVPAPVLPRPARPELDEPRGVGGPGADAAVLAGPRGRRVPHRRGARNVQVPRRSMRCPPTTTRGSTPTTSTTCTG